MKKNIWKDFEADNWFKRNQQDIKKKNINEDLVIFLLKLYKIKPKRAIEVGAANGYRLSYIYKLYNSKVVAVEPSSKAVKDGRKRFPYIKFFCSLCEEINIKAKFDLVIVNFVFHWIYREKLFTCLKNIDNFVENNGYLVIGDFGTENLIKRKYHHLKKSEFYTWKMPYWKLFTNSGNYLEIAKLRYDISMQKAKLTTDLDFNNMGTVVLLKKQSCFC